MTDNAADGNQRTDPERPWTDPDRLRELYVDERLSQSEVADRLGCARQTITKWMGIHDIDARTQSESQYVFGPEDADELRRLYVAELWTAAEIGEEYDCHETAVLETLHRFDIPVRPRGAESDTLVLRDEAQLRELYVDEEMAHTEIADELECASSTVMAWLHNHGIETRSQGRSGEEHHNWRGGVGHEYYGFSFRRIRPTVIERDDGECRDCGLPRSEHRRITGRDLEVHHIVPFDPREPEEPQNDPENLITLCRECHMERHRDES